MSDVILKIEDLKTHFKVGKHTVYAVNGVDLELHRGRTLGIVGESGCGKSVTAHSILQLLPKAGKIAGGKITYTPEAGGRQLELSSYKRNSTDIRGVRGKDIAMVFQDPMSSLNPVYRIGKQITENLYKHEKISRPAARARAVAMLEKLGIPLPDKRFDQYPHEFSGGMRQRVMIAIAMICNPNILIADEPTTALDVTIQAQILALMKELRRDFGTSVILITHNMGIVAESCDDVAVMYMGKVVESGSLDQIFNNPLHPYTRALMKSVPVLGKDRRARLESIDGNTPDAATKFFYCEFQPRCNEAGAFCKEGFPVCTSFDTGHTVRCKLYERGG